MRALLGTILTVCLCLMTSQLMADGGLIPVYGKATQVEAAASGAVSSDGQRALLWRSAETTWDIYIDPGRSSYEEVAWVVPFPVVPEVEFVDPSFMDELDAATTAVLANKLLQYEIVDWESTGDGLGGCCFGGADSGRGEPQYADASSESRVMTPPVRVLGSGELGAMSYEIVGTQSGEALQSWLERNGYDISEQLGALSAEYIEKNYVFFAAKFSRHSGQSEELGLLRFRLEGVEQVEYPMLLTRLSVAEQFRFTIWVVDELSENVLHVPEELGFQVPNVTFPEQQTHSVDAVDDLDLVAEYQARIDDINERGLLALQFNSRLETDQTLARVAVLEQGAADFPLSRSVQDWHPLLRAMHDRRLVVARFRGALPTASMVDLHFSPTPQSSTQEVDAYYERIVHIRGYYAKLGNSKPAAERGVASLLLVLIPFVLGMRRSNARRGA